VVRIVVEVGDAVADAAAVDTFVLAGFVSLRITCVAPEVVDRLGMFVAARTCCTPAVNGACGDRDRSEDVELLMLLTSEIGRR
jgi:hypothetical protein